ncbi:MAG TPA: hypothetical protein VK934_03985 [Fimbriimonas sp.]|nr:hypothetical protein [Fimbriimonas sp.]
MSTAQKTNPRDLKQITSQGFYVAAPDGTAFGFNNNRDIDRVLGFLSKGLADYKKSNVAVASISDEEVNATFTRKPSEPVSYVRVFARIKPVPDGCDGANHNVARDHVWIYKSDLEQFVGKTSKFAMPAEMMNRLVRYHLVDNIRGEPVFWSAQEVKSAAFTVTPKGKDVFTFSGAYRMATVDNGRGLEGKLDGELRIDAAKMEAKSFKAYGEAKAWGAGPYTPNPPPGKFPLVFAFVSVNDEMAKATPPQAAAYGDYEYKKG